MPREHECPTEPGPASWQKPLLAYVQVFEQIIGGEVGGGGVGGGGNLGEGGGGDAGAGGGSLGCGGGEDGDWVAVLVVVLGELDECVTAIAMLKSTHSIGVKQRWTGAPVGAPNDERGGTCVRTRFSNEFAKWAYRRRA